MNKPDAPVAEHAPDTLPAPPVFIDPRAGRWLPVALLIEAALVVVPVFYAREVTEAALAAQRSAQAGLNYAAFWVLAFLAAIALAIYGGLQWRTLTPARRLMAFLPILLGMLVLLAATLMGIKR